MRCAASPSTRPARAGHAYRARDLLLARPRRAAPSANASCSTQAGGGDVRAWGGAAGAQRAGGERELRGRGCVISWPSRWCLPVAARQQIACNAHAVGIASVQITMQFGILGPLDVCADGE